MILIAYKTCFTTLLATHAVAPWAHHAPSAFAATLHQHRFAPLADAQALLGVLQAECALKEDAGRRIGLV